VPLPKTCSPLDARSWESAGIDWEPAAALWLDGVGIDRDPEALWLDDLGIDWELEALWLDGVGIDCEAEELWLELWQASKLKPKMLQVINLKNIIDNFSLALKRIITLTYQPEPN
jgi:hypothetical protein